MDNQWMAQGYCRSEPPAMFFPSDGVGVEVAKQICQECPVKAPCLDYALTQRIDHGVWGGTSERQRRRILRKRRLDVQALSETPALSGTPALGTTAMSLSESLTSAGAAAR